MVETTVESGAKHGRAGSGARGERPELGRRFGINNTNLAVRREFIRLGEREAQLLGELAGWIRREAAAVAREFYDWQFQFPPTRRFFEEHARRRGVPLDELRQHLERTQARYLTEIFEGAASRWDSEYFERRLYVGWLHDKINLPFKWYIGSYIELDRLLGEHLRRKLEDPAKAEEAAQAVRKVFNYDIQAIGDSFLLNTLESIGVGIDWVETDAGSDRTEHLAAVKAAIKMLLEQAGALARGELAHESLRGGAGQASRGRLSESIGAVFSTIQALVEDVGMLARAAAEGRVGARADVGRHQGDYRRIVEGVNQILASIGEQIRETAQNAVVLASASEELMAVSQQVAGNAEETATQANVVSAASEQVSTNVSSVASAAEEMQASIREIARHANESAKVARNAVSVAESTNETVKKLGESSQEIGNVIKVITSIAQQTNLLALNATIEAARAGEAGKGFAVVANEVKELAKQTAKATEEIGRKIEAIQADTKGAVEAIGEIGAIINQINGISNSIAAAVEEQTVTTNEIGRSVTEGAKGVEEIARNISAVAQAARNTSQGVGEAAKAVRELSQVASRLQAMVSRFQF